MSLLDDMIKETIYTSIPNNRIRYVGSGVPMPVPRPFLTRKTNRSSTNVIRPTIENMEQIRLMTPTMAKELIMTSTNLPEKRFHVIENIIPISNRKNLLP